LSPPMKEKSRFVAFTKVTSLFAGRRRKGGEGLHCRSRERGPLAKDGEEKGGVLKTNWLGKRKSHNKKEGERGKNASSARWGGGGGKGGNQPKEGREESSAIIQPI